MARRSSPAVARSAAAASPAVAQTPPPAQPLTLERIFASPALTGNSPRLLKLSPDDAFRLQKDYYRRYGTTLRGLMLEHGMEPDDFLDFVHQIETTLLAAGQLVAHIAVLTL